MKRGHSPASWRRLVRRAALVARSNATTIRATPARRRLLRRAAFVAAGIGGVAAAVVLGIGVWVSLPLPPELARPGVVPSLVIQDRHGLALRTTRAEDGSRGGWVPFSEVDPELIQAFVAAEDGRFFEHRGVDVRAVARALRDNLAAGRVVSGASTLTMQTARLLRPTPRSWHGKLAQALWALRLEAHLDKATILEQYLNRVPLGQGAVGVEAAARLYFGRSARDLSLGQAALLAGLARAPSRDNPLVDPARARERRDRVLDRMATLGFARPEDVARAREEPVGANAAPASFLAPHFTTQLLLRAEADVAPTGTWRTTLDLALQEELEAEVRHTVARLAERGARHAAAVVLENHTGAILAWVGSPDFFADADGQVDMVVSRRQPGSTLKPFLYGLAFDRGYTAATVLPDVPRTYETTTGPYRPRNYDRRFRGPVRARVALASSLNVPAVELAHRLGVGAFLATLHDAGFESLDQSADHYGLGLALGNGDVTLLELANAYRGLANGGVWRPVRWLEAVDDAPVPAAAEEGRRFLSAGAAALVLDILSDPVARIPGFGVETPLDFPFPAAAKTGTSRHFTDNWAVAVTGGFTVAVWVGDFTGRPMRGVSGISGAGPLLYRAVLRVARRYPPGHLPAPEGVGATAVPVCLVSGLRAANGCPSTVEWFLPGTEPTRDDDWHRDGRVVLPAEYTEWLAMGGEAAVVVDDQVAADAAAAPDGVGLPAPGGAAYAVAGRAAGGQTGARAPSARRILSPADGDVYELPVGVDPRYATIPLLAAGQEPVRWFVDGVPHAGARWRLVPGAHTIRAEWASGARDSVRIVVR
jgi:penicillin-binding protein 1C